MEIDNLVRNLVGEGHYEHDVQTIGFGSSFRHEPE
jgi:hypothetical protein